MTAVQLADVILTVLVLALGAYSAYIKAGKTIYSKASFLIAEAAELDILGAEKMKRVVNQLYEYIPPLLKKLLNKTKLEQIAQSIYDDMKLFAENDGKE